MTDLNGLHLVYYERNIVLVTVTGYKKVGIDFVMVEHIQF